MEASNFICESEFSDDIKTLINSINKIQDSYEDTIKRLEDFFNSELQQSDLDNFKSLNFNLSDKNENFYFPFKLENGKLKFDGSGIWKSIFILAILDMNFQSKIKK